MSGSKKLRSPSDARRFLLGVEIEAGELAVRILEAMYGVRRPDGLSAVDAIEHLKSAGQADACTSALKAAKAAVGYFGECINRAGGVS